MSKREAAAALANKGFRVFPIRTNGKKPLIPDWPERAVSDPVRARKWWTETDGAERDWNIGVLCDDLLVIDIEGEAKYGVDPLHVLEQIEVETGLELPHLVRTPSNGYHAYLRLPEGACVANTAKTLWPTVDTKSCHGYVLGAGSIVDGKTYEWQISTEDQTIEPRHISDLRTAPLKLIERIGKPRDAAPLDPNIEWDTPAAIALATAYLKKDAPPSVQGEAGDLNAYRVACRLRDMAVSHDLGLDMMLEHWNERCEPPWQAEELQAKVASAYAYATGAPWPPGSEFEAVKGVDEIEGHSAPKGVAFPFIPLRLVDRAKMPKREWIIPGLLARTFLTVLASSPGAGKTQLLSQIAATVAGNRPDILGRQVEDPCAVWFYNAEDDSDELNRRFGATFKRFSLDVPNLKHPIAVASGVDHPFSIAKYDRATGQVMVSKVKVDYLIKTIKENNVGLLIADPLAELHGAPENDNDAMKLVTGAFRRIAQEANCAVLIAAHTRKQSGSSPDGIAGNQDTLRGAGAQTGVARIVLTLAGMTEKEAKLFGVAADQRSNYQRLDVAKGNITPAARGGAPEWFKWENVPLENGDHVGVLVKADLSSSRLRQEIDNAEIMAAILAKQPEAHVGASWAKAVMPAFMLQTGMSAGMAKKWFSGLEPETEVSMGVVAKIDRAGAGGSLLRLTPGTDASTDDVFG